MQIGFEHNTTMSQNNLNVIMNYKLQQQHQTKAGSGNSFTTNKTTLAAGSSFSQQRTLFEGRVPGPMRYEELVKGHEYEGKEGDQEILLMERNNLKLTFHKGIAQQITPTTRGSSDHNSHTYNTSVINQHQPANILEQHQGSEIDRFALYGHQHPCATIADAVANGPERMSARRESPWAHQTGNNNDNLNPTGGYRWSTGQMEVTPTNNIHSQQKFHPLSQNHSAEYKIPMMDLKSSYSPSMTHHHETKKQTLYQSPDFIDQQLNSHLKSFKYIKPSQQQPKSLYQVGNSMSMAYNNPATYCPNLNSTPNTSATITKISNSHLQNSTRTFFESGSNPGTSHGSGNVMLGNNMKSISTLSTKSKPNFKQKLQIMQPQSTQTSPRAALEHYEKLRKYWDYQHHLLGEDQDYQNYSNPHNNNYTTASHHNSGYDVPMNSNSNWQQSRNNFTQGRGHTISGTEAMLNTGNYRQILPQPNPYSNSANNHNQQLKMQNEHVHPPMGTSTSARDASGFAAELEKLQNYNFAHVQQKREWGWPYNNNKATPPTPAQKKTYPNNTYADSARQHYVQQFYKAVEMQRKQSPRSRLIVEENSHVPPPVPPPTPNNETRMTEAASPRRSSIIQNNDRAEVEIIDCVDYSKPKIFFGHRTAPKDGNQLSEKRPELVQIARQETTDKCHSHSGGTVVVAAHTPTDLSITRRRSDQDQRLLLNNARFTHKSPQPPQPQRSQSVGGITDVSGYDHIVLLDKRVMTYMCKRCLETLKSDQEIRNHLFCKMLQDSIQCHVCRNLYPCEDYPEHLKGHGVRAFSN